MIFIIAFLLCSAAFSSLFQTRVSRLLFLVAHTKQHTRNLFHYYRYIRLSHFSRSSFRCFFYHHLRSLFFFPLPVSSPLLEISLIMIVRTSCLLFPFEEKLFSLYIIQLETANGNSLNNK